jgi:anti-anti-sigma factor
METMSTVLGKTRIIRPDCESDLSAVESAIAASETFPEILLDLSAMDYINSAFIGMLLGIKNGRPGVFGNLKLVNPNSMISEILDMTQLNRIFEIRKIYPTAW